MRSFKLLGRLLGLRPLCMSRKEVRVAILRGDPFTLEPGMEVIKAPLCPEAERIAESIRLFPLDWAWSHKGYKLINTPSGFMLWVANKDYGLAEVIQGDERQAVFALHCAADLPNVPQCQRRVVAHDQRGIHQLVHRRG